jgi:hypothetical protein
MKWSELGIAHVNTNKPETYGICYVCGTKAPFITICGTTTKQYNNNYDKVRLLLRTIDITLQTTVLKDVWEWEGNKTFCSEECLNSLIEQCKVEITMAFVEML